MHLQDWLRSKGYDFIPELDNKTHRFKVEGDDANEKSGWYIGSESLSTGGKVYSSITVSNWRTGEKETFPGKNGHAWSEEERTEYEAQWKKQKEIAEKEQQSKWIEAAKKAGALLGQASREDSNGNKYLQRKNIALHGARCLDDKLLIPLYQQEGEICGAQTILDDGSKKFIPGTKAMGAFFKIPGENTKAIAICEGFATGATLSQATGFDIYVAFSCGNLGNIVDKVRRTNEGRQIVIFGDDDKWTEGNPGRKYCADIQKVRPELISLFPVFLREETKPSDWNDLHCLEGLNEVKRQIQNGLQKSAGSNDSGNGTCEEEKRNRSTPGINLTTKNIRESSEENSTQESDDDEPNMSKAVRINGKYLNLPHFGSKGKPMATVENLKALLNHFGIVVRYNVISKEEEILVPNESFTVDNKAVGSLACIISWCNQARIPIGNLSEFLSRIADENLYNPVATWIESCPWDGQSRLQDMFETVTSPTKLKNLLMEKWFISAIAAAYQPNGVAAQGVLVFRGKQYAGKTRWFKKLAPNELDILKDGAILHPDDKDSVFQCVCKWLVELGELDATFRKADIAQLKAFLTKDQDVLRRAYARKESHYARRTVFFASVNEECFLADPTGNRRFWSIECEAIDCDHLIDMQQFWAEILTLYKAGKDWHLTQEENIELNQSNEDFQTVDPIEEKIRQAFKWEESKIEWLSATEVCEKIGIDHPNIQQAKKVSGTLRKLSTEFKRIKGLTRFHMPRRSL